MASRTTALIPLALLILAGVVAQQPPQRIPKQLPPDIIPPELFKHRDALQIDPMHYQLDLENERVRVLRLTLKAHEAVPVYDADDALVVCLKECHLRLDRPGGHSEEVHMEAGKTRWIFGDARSERNLSSEPVEVLFVEPKGAKSSR